MSRTAKMFLPIAAVSILLAVVLGFVGANFQGNESAEGGEEAGTTEMPIFIQNNCTTCHGNDLQGMSGIPNLHQTELSKEEIINVLKNGKGNMPADLIPGKEEQAADYLLSLGESAGGESSGGEDSGEGH